MKQFNYFARFVPSILLKWNHLLKKRTDSFRIKFCPWRALFEELHPPEKQTEIHVTKNKRMSKTYINNKTSNQLHICTCGSAALLSANTTSGFWERPIKTSNGGFSLICMDTQSLGVFFSICIPPSPTFSNQWALLQKFLPQEQILSSKSRQNFEML